MDSKILTERLKEKFEESGLTLKEVSEISGVSAGSLYRFFQRGDEPSMRTLLKLKRAIPFRFDYIFQLNDK